MTSGTARICTLLAVLGAVLAAPGAHAQVLAPWCGTTDATSDLQPDLVSAFQIHVILAYPSDGADRLAQLAAPIASDVETITNWWLGQDPTREPRWDFYSFPSCPSRFGDLDISSVRLPHKTAYYSSPDTRFDDVVYDLFSLGFDDLDKKYLVYFEASINTANGLCGDATTGQPDAGGFEGYSVVFLSGECATGLGSGGTATVVAAQELVRGLGAFAADPYLIPGPQHACPNDEGYACDSPTDILYPSQNTNVQLGQLVLDYGRDDYYGHHGSWYDVRKSFFLTRLDSPDQAPPVGPVKVTVTSNGVFVYLSWTRAKDDVGPVTYRVYQDGALYNTTTLLSEILTAPLGETLDLAVRAEDAVGFLGRLKTIRFEVGLGIVDKSGKLVKDTVPPPAISSLYATKTATALRITWMPVTDLGGLKGYRILRNGVFYALDKKPVLIVPVARERGHWSVGAVDLSGNRGTAAQIEVR